MLNYKNYSYYLEDGENFDLEFYKYFYEDIKNLSLNLINYHYKYYGKPEGRFFSEKQIRDFVDNDEFDLDEYKKINPELLLSNHELVHHYKYYGKPEGRFCSEKQIRDFVDNDEFDLDYYKKMNPELLFLSNSHLVHHYKNYGKLEGRFCSEKQIRDFVDNDKFELDYYKKMNPELLLSNHELVHHYKDYGKSEGRIISQKQLDELIASTGNPEFDINFYKEFYKDLSDVYGSHLIEHYNTWGKNEERIVSEKQITESYLTEKQIIDFVNDKSIINFYENDTSKNNFFINKMNIDNLDNNCAIIFICHNLKSFNMVERYLDIKNCFIIIVGNDTNFIDSINYQDNKIIISKNYPFNIENEYKLLTFTAWYLIVKNNLFVNYNHICILEYDVSFYNDVFKKLELLTNYYDIISFIGGTNDFHSDININIMNEFLISKNIDTNTYDNKNLFWYHTTNHCIKRNILKDFVEWYYPDCLIIGLNDDVKYSYYHERMFSVYILEKKYKIFLFKNNLFHYQLSSHTNNQCNIEKKYFLIYDDNTNIFNNHIKNLVLSINKYSNFCIKLFNKTNIDSRFIETYKSILSEKRGGGYWLWKPYIILKILNELNDNDILFYIDSKYFFVKNFEKLYIDKLLETDIVVWKNKPNEEITYLKNYCKMDVIKKYDMEDIIFDKSGECCWAGAIVIKKTQKSIKIIKKWLEMCCNEDDITDMKSTIPNSNLFIDHRHDQSLLSIVLHKYNIPFYYFEKNYLQNVRCPW